MWMAMEAAEIGWAQKGQDPNVARLERTAAELTGKEAATGPLMFQGDHGAVSFRNLKITPN